MSNNDGTDGEKFEMIPSPAVQGVMGARRAMDGRPRFSGDELMDLNQHLAWLESQILVGVGDESGPFSSGADVVQREKMVKFIGRLISRLHDLQVATAPGCEPIQARNFVEAVMQDWKTSPRFAKAKGYIKRHGGRFRVDLAPFVPDALLMPVALMRTLADHPVYEGLWPGAVIWVDLVEWTERPGLAGARLDKLRIRAVPLLPMANGGGNSNG